MFGMADRRRKCSRRTLYYVNRLCEIPALPTTTPTPFALSISHGDPPPRPKNNPCRPMSTLARQAAKTVRYQTIAGECRRAPWLWGTCPMLNCRRAPRSNSLHLGTKERRHARFPNSFSSPDESAIADPCCNPTACFGQFFGHPGSSFAMIP